MPDGGDALSGLQGSCCWKANAHTARRVMGIKNPAPGTGFFKIFGDSERVSNAQTETGLAFVGIFHTHVTDFDIG